MRLRFVVAILALSLSVQTALAAVCATGCATMTANSSHHGGDSAPVVPPVLDSPDAHQGHHTAPVTSTFAEIGADPATGAVLSLSGASVKCPLPESAKQRPRSVLESTFAEASPSAVPFVSASGANHSPSLSIPPDLSPPARFTVLRI